MKKVVGLVVGLLLCPVAVCAILALIVCAIAGDVPGKLLGAFTSCYVLFGGWSIPHIVFLFAFGDDNADLAWPFGMGIYYGTLVSSAVLYKVFGVGQAISLAIGFVVASLCCVIAWMYTKKNRQG